MIDFPASPTVGQTFTAAGVTWTWTGVVWTASGSGGGGRSSISVGDTPPASPNVGDLWWDSVGGQLYVWYNDGNTSQWVIANSLGPNAASFITIGDAPPATPAAIGALWFDSVGSQLYVWFGDGTSNQWVPATNQMGGGYLLAKGVVDGSDAPGGQIGEIISAVNTAGATIANSVAQNIASIALTPGDWDISGEAWFTGASGITAVTASVSSSSNTLSTLGMGGSRAQVSATAAGAQLLSLAPCRVSSATATTWYLVGYITFTTGPCTNTGKIWARRAR